jgi:hypothetical protein
MDHAVALVEAYLRVNGYFTVSEYPVVEARHYDGFRTATDLDILAFRFPGAGGLAPSGPGEQNEDNSNYAPDPALGCRPDCAEMLIGEVKEGKAELNEAARTQRSYRLRLHASVAAIVATFPKLSNSCCRRGAL